MLATVKKTCTFFAKISFRSCLGPVRVYDKSKGRRCVEFLTTKQQLLRLAESCRLAAKQLEPWD